MNVSGLYNSDEVKVLYNAQYANHTAAENVQVTVDDLKWTIRSVRVTTIRFHLIQ